MRTGTAGEGEPPDLRAAPAGSPPRRRVDGIVGLAIAGVVFAVYAATLCPTIYIEDAAEFSTAAAVFGVPHPPGYPLYTLLAAVFARVVRVGDMAFRSNLFSAVCGALALALLWALLCRLGRGRIAALAAVGCLAFGSTFWSQCLVAEVHSLNCALLILALLAAVAAADQPTKRSLLLCGAAVGLLVGHRNMNVIFVPAFWAVVDAGLKRTGRNAGARARLFGFALGAGAATALVYLYLPLAARRGPPLNIGAPVTLSRFYAVISAQSYFRHFAAAGLGTDLDRVLTFVKRWPWDVGVAALAAPVGFVWWGGPGRTDEKPRSRTIPLALLYVFLSCVAFSAMYNVLDVAVYFLPAHVVLVIFAGFAFDVCIRSATARARTIVAAAALALGLAAVPLNLASTSLHNTRIAEIYARDLWRSAPANAILISFGDTSDHVLGYGQAVEHQRPDVVVVSANQLSDWYQQQLRGHHPAVAWPGPETVKSGGWLAELVNGNAGVRPVCLTHPLDLGLDAWSRVPQGLLTCFHEPGDRGALPRALTRSVEFWRDATIPGASQLEHADVHVHMVAFAYATARFTLARALAEANDVAGARAQLQALAAAAPDQQEATIALAMRTIGKEQQRSFALGARAARALRVRPDDTAALREALADTP